MTLRSLQTCRAELEQFKAERDALKVALEMMLGYEPNYCVCGDEVLTAVGDEAFCNKPTEVWATARAALKAPQPEPVVYMDRDCVEHPSGWRFLHSKAMANENSVPLYTAPPQPLSLDQISMIFNRVYPAQPLSQNIINLVQEVEKHHRIR
jgi:hypothetical protein